MLGIAGVLSDLDLITKWIDDGEGEKKPKISRDTDALRLMPDGRLLHYAYDLMPEPIGAPFAIGSGADFAIGAMDQGATPVRAVERAIARDPFSGGAITCLALEP